jgi:hypothetical protein
MATKLGSLPSVTWGMGICAGLVLACGKVADLPGRNGRAGSTRPASMSGSTSNTAGASTSVPVLVLSSSSSTNTSTACDSAPCCAPGMGTIDGYVHDPAGRNPVYSASVYVLDPESPLPNLDVLPPVSCGCSQLFPRSVLADSLLTDTTGFFQIPCAPSGTWSVVVQIGWWRMQYDGIHVTPGAVTHLPSLRLPSSSAEGSLPDIAVSTGGEDSLECLLRRIGVAASEYVQGSAAGGHIHVYAGFEGATTRTAAPESAAALWDSQADLDRHNLVLLSCEGQETTGGNPGLALTDSMRAYLQNYGNGGGRVFASHFHYAWFDSGPFATGPKPLASWATGSQSIDDTTSLPGVVNTSLASGAGFPSGIALNAWLGNVGALTTSGQLPIWFGRHNVSALLQPPTTEWIHLDPSVTQAPGATQYFSVDMPIGNPPEAICGRIVYSDLHAGGPPGVAIPSFAPDYPGATPNNPGVVPDGCAVRELSPQESALEFMLFDLSTCIPLAP